MNDTQYSDSDRQRLIRRRNDLVSAQLLAQTTAMQYELSKNNIGILVDKFNAIGNVLKPALEMNMKITSNDFKNITKLF